MNSETLNNLKAISTCIVFKAKDKPKENRLKIYSINSPRTYNDSRLLFHHHRHISTCY